MTPEYVNSRLTYDPYTGKMYWKHADFMYKQWLAKFAGKEAFTARDKEGYVSGAINNKTYLGHRVAWCLYWGAWPTDEIDHQNHIRDDNRMDNLVIAGASGNRHNMSGPGQYGVSWRADTQKWTARIMVEYAPISLGCFNDFDEAVRVRKAAEVLYRFHENHGR